MSATGFNDPQLWERVAEVIGEHPYTYDLDDRSHRLDVVQIVCEALSTLASIERGVEQLERGAAVSLGTFAENEP